MWFLKNKKPEERIEILRIEDRNGYGVHQILWEVAIEHCFSDYDESLFNENCPELIADKDFKGKIKINKNKHGYYLSMIDYYSGFLNKEQYLNWVYQHKWRVSLNRFGGKLITYSVPISKIIYGHKQILFKKKSSKKVEEQSLLIFD